MSDRLGVVDGTGPKGARVRRRLDTWQVVVLAVLFVLGVSVALDMIRAVGGQLAGLLWFGLAVGVGVFCGWLAEQVTRD